MRPDRDETFLMVADVLAVRTTCLRRGVGCVLTNKRGHVLSTGYNGVASGVRHCNFQPRPIAGGVTEAFPYACAGAGADSGSRLDDCQAIHAEANALLQCPDVHQIETCYVTVAPCISCVKLLLGTSCQRIVFSEQYPHHEAARLWNRPWIHLPRRTSSSPA